MLFPVVAFRYVDRFLNAGVEHHFGKQCQQSTDCLREMVLVRERFWRENCYFLDLSVSSDIVIGVTFLKKYKAVIDFNTNVLSLNDSLTTDLTVISDDNDILSLTDLTKLDPHGMKSVRVKVPTRFNGKIIQVTPLRAIKDNDVLLEHSINKPVHGITHILLTNATNDRNIFSIEINIYNHIFV